jgi:hypothetical protein
LSSGFLNDGFIYAMVLDVEEAYFGGYIFYFGCDCSTVVETSVDKGKINDWDFVWESCSRLGYRYISSDGSAVVSKHEFREAWLGFCYCVGHDDDDRRRMTSSSELMRYREYIDSNGFSLASKPLCEISGELRRRTVSK